MYRRPEGPAIPGSACLSIDPGRRAAHDLEGEPPMTFFVAAWLAVLALVALGTANLFCVVLAAGEGSVQSRQGTPYRRDVLWPGHWPSCCCGNCTLPFTGGGGR